MTTLPDDALRVPQHEVQRLLGRCLLGVQQYERLLKAIVADHKISGAPSELDAVRAARRENIAKKTLGSLVGSLLGSYIANGAVAAPAEGATSSLEGNNWMEFRAYTEFSAADFAQIETDLKELVHLRNNLVHHFIDEYDLWSLEGCRDAQYALIAARERIDQRYNQLREWAEDMLRVQQAMGNFFLSDRSRELLVNGIALDGSVLWPIAGIVYGLREAADKLAVKGWTSIEEARKRIAVREPDQLPARYGCISWRQVVHESGMFELRYFNVDGQRSAWYREKAIAKSIHSSAWRADFSDST